MRHLTGELRPRTPRRGASARRERTPWRSSPWARCGPWAKRGLGLAAVALLVAVATITAFAPGPAAWLGARRDAVVGTLARATADAGFAVHEVYVRGRHETSAGDVLAVLDVDLGDPLLLLDLEARRRALETLPWVEHAAIERRLPDVLVVRLAERQPLARWQNAGAVAVVDRGGASIPGADPGRFGDLLLVVGPDAPSHAAALIAVLGAEPELARRVAAAQRVGDRRWELHFDNGVTVALPAEGWSEAWRRFAALEREHGLLGRALVRVDLRFPDRVVLRLTEPAAEALEKAATARGGEST
ncbi:MAG: cell division protein FtsQ/DivIB [Alphaproteobacteria bacterium]